MLNLKKFFVYPFVKHQCGELDLNPDGFSIDSCTAVVTGEAPLLPKWKKGMTGYVYLPPVH